MLSLGKQPTMSRVLRQHLCLLFPPPWLVRPCSIRKQLFCAPLSPSLSLRRTLALDGNATDFPYSTLPRDV